MSEEHDDAQRLFHRLNQTRADNGDKLSREEWLRITAEQFRAVRDDERRDAGRRPKRSKGIRDPLFDTLAVACGMNLKEITRTAAQTVGVALAGIRTATPDVTPEEITIRVNTYKRQHATWALTPKTIEKHWPTLGTGRATAQAAAVDPRIAQGAPKGWKEWMERRIARWLDDNPRSDRSQAPGDYHLRNGEFFKMPVSWQTQCWAELTGQ